MSKVEKVFQLWLLGNSKDCQPCASSENYSAYRPQSYEVLLYVCTYLISANDSREPLWSSLEVLLCIALSSRALSPANSSCLDHSELQTLVPALSKTRFFLGFTSLHHCPGNYLQAMWRLTLFASLLSGSQSCAACCLMSENSCFLYFVPFLVVCGMKVIQESLTASWPEVEVQNDGLWN